MPDNDTLKSAKKIDDADTPEKIEFGKTVRAQKHRQADVQQFLPISEIRNDTVFLKNGGMRAVLEIEAINFNLKSETEQQAIIAGYGAFANTLSFPVQIVIRSYKTNIDPYLNYLESVGQNQPNPLLKAQTLSYAQFLRQILETADIMQKRFYIIIPFDEEERKKTMVEKMFSFMGNSTDSVGKASYRHTEFNKHNAKLKERVELVRTGLENIGLRTHQLDTRQLVEVYYQIYNPLTSISQKLPEDLELLHIKKDVL
ncbi:hypothetical protein HYZ98_02155 [Candidatus Peregrinibacteria bacterium]|nr:hypothetical protein [Candidatus Peregrinibacteria bacterium]